LKQFFFCNLPDLIVTTLLILSKEIKMIKKSLLVLVLIPVMVGSAFAQADFGTMPKNTITVDFGPTFGAWALGAYAITEGFWLGIPPNEESFDFSSFGIAAQYERQLLPRLSVAGRFAYLGFGVGIVYDSDELKANAQTNLSSFSLESHVRYYPFNGTFFLDGMLGYTYLLVGLTGDYIYTEDNGSTKTVNISRNSSRNYLKIGGKLGWRINIGRQGGFTIEPSFGYYDGIGFGDTIKEAYLTNGIAGNARGLDEAYIMRFFCISGPRFSLALGWRF
jgi:hypothetical protein